MVNFIINVVRAINAESNGVVELCAVHKQASVHSTLVSAQSVVCTVQCNTVQCSAMQWSAVQCSAVQFSAVHCAQLSRAVFSAEAGVQCRLQSAVYSVPDAGGDREELLHYSSIHCTASTAPELALNALLKYSTVHSGLSRKY